MSKPNLDQQITTLQNRADRLRSEMMALPKNRTSPHKRRMRDDEANLRTELTILRDKRDNEREAQAFSKINDLFKTTNNTIIVRVNGLKVQPDQDLNITLRFSCGHTRRTHISEILSYQKECANNRVLLARWTATLNTQTTLNTRFSCDQCKKAKSKRFNKFRTRNDSDIIGTARMSIEIIK